MFSEFYYSYRHRNKYAQSDILGRNVDKQLKQDFQLVNCVEGKLYEEGTRP